MQGSVSEISRGNVKTRMLRRLWAPIFIMSAISILSGTAGVQTGDWTFTGMDKLGHLVVFGLLGIAWARMFSEFRSAPLRCWIYSVLLATIFGLADEFHQYHNPLRTFEWADLAADFVGSAMAVTIYQTVDSVRNLCEMKIERFLRLPFKFKNKDS